MAKKNVNTRLIRKLLKSIFVAFYYLSVIFTLLIFDAKVFRMGLSRSISVIKSDIFSEDLKLYVFIIIAPFLFLTGIFLRLIVRKVISRIHVYILGGLILTLIVGGYIFFTFISPRIEKGQQEKIQRQIKIEQGCIEKAEIGAKKKAEEKGYKPNTDTYFVIYISSKTFIYNWCRYENGLIENPPTGHNFNFLPSVK